MPRNRLAHRLLVRAATLLPTRHRELVRGMVAEMEAITEPAEQTKFMIGAFAAIGRLAVRGCVLALLDSPRHPLGVPNAVRCAHPGGFAVSEILPRQLLGRHARPFAVAVATLTSLLMANQVLRWVPRLMERGASAGTIVEVVFLSLPFTLALSVPLAVFPAVCWVFTRLGREGALESSRSGFRRLALPVLCGAAVVSAATLVLNTEVLPRANARLVAVLTGSEARPSEREMTLGELRDAARSARAVPGSGAAARVAQLEVEIQKRLAIAAACMVLALAGASIVSRFPGGGTGLVVGGTVLVSLGYYAALIAGESLADRQVISPGIAMWTANVLLLGLALALAWRPGGLQSDSESP